MGLGRDRVVSVRGRRDVRKAAAGRRVLDGRRVEVWRPVLFGRCEFGVM